jgi:hypothetical protein
MAILAMNSHGQDARATSNWTIPDPGARQRLGKDVDSRFRGNDRQLAAGAVAKGHAGQAKEAFY